MIPEERFGRWAAIGVSASVLECLVLAVALHLCRGISWTEFAFPSGLFTGLQTAFFLAVCWAGKLARRQHKFGPMTIFVGFFCWSAVMLIIHYGNKWGLESSLGAGDYAPFTICMVIVTVISFLIFWKFGDKFLSPIETISEQDNDSRSRR